MRPVLVCAVAFSIACTASAQVPVVRTGIEALMDSNFEIFRGKRIGLITNQTGVDQNLRSTIDILHNAKDVRLVALFGPEHGVRGDISAGDPVESFKDSWTNVQVYSLYGKTRKPTPEMLGNIDALVYDIQDIGTRSYTYISTMGLAMEAAAENNIEFIVLDRPNPLGGIRIEGNIVEEGFFSFVSRFPIPYVYGLTCGELARLLNGEGLLAGGVTCKLTVIPMKGWKRAMTFKDTGLPWVLTSPNIPTEDSPQYNVGTGIMGELSVLSEGIGYTIPFRICAAEWIDPNRFARALDSLELPGIRFRPISFRPWFGPFKDKELKGVQLYIFDESKINLMSLQFLLMQAHQRLYPDKNPFILADSNRVRTFDRVAGTDKVRRLFMQRMRYEDVKDFLGKDEERFREIAARYWLYE
jgi:uncharacterized protein YbbC (DUF1343 family)